MDYRERKRLEHEIDRGVPNTGIRKVDGDALEKENRSALVKGAGGRILYQRSCRRRLSAEHQHLPPITAGAVSR